MDRSTSKKYAVKIIAKNTMLDRARLWKEVQILRQVGRHPNVVQLVDVYEDDDYVYLVME